MIPPEIQSRLDEEADFRDAVDAVKGKAAMDPGAVTMEDAAYLESGKRKAHGRVEKGGAAVTAQSLASQNERWMGVDACVGERCIILDCLIE